MTMDLQAVTTQEFLGEKTDWFTLLANETQSEASRTSGVQRATKAAGVLLQVVTNAKAGTVTFTPQIQVPSAEDPTVGVTIAAFTAISASGTNILVFHPTAADMGAEDKVGTLPREWLLKMLYTGADTTNRMDTAVYARYI